MLIDLSPEEIADRLSQALKVAGGDQFCVKLEADEDKTLWCSLADSQSGISIARIEVQDTLSVRLLKRWALDCLQSRLKNSIIISLETTIETYLGGA